VHVDDVVSANLWFLDHPDASGIFNVGTGRASTYNAMAAAVINAVDRRGGRPERDVEGMVRDGAITYVAFPPTLAGRYQSHTEADLFALRAAGYEAPFAAIEVGVDRYVERLMAAA